MIGQGSPLARCRIDIEHVVSVSAAQEVNEVLQLVDAPLAIFKENDVLGAVVPTWLPFNSSSGLATIIVHFLGSSCCSSQRKRVFPMVIG